jgi:hypothetical protein
MASETLQGGVSGNEFKMRILFFFFHGSGSLDQFDPYRPCNGRPIFIKKKRQGLFDFSIPAPGKETYPGARVNKDKG